MTRSKRRGLGVTAIAVGLLAAVPLSAGCGSDNSGGGATTAASSHPSEAAGSTLPQGSEPVSLDPAEFTVSIDNPYWPMKPGSRWVYRETTADGSVQRVVVTVTGKTKEIANGIQARVVSDVVSKGGQPVEVTDDWYAQDAAGNIWYLGEATAEYESGKVASRAGSFEAGVDGAQPGIALPAHPRPGLAYRQEYYTGQAEDRGVVLDTDAQAGVPFGHFSGALMTKDLTPLEPDVEELKFYAKGVGPVLTLTASPDAGREELLSYTTGQ